MTKMDQLLESLSSEQKKTVREHIQGIITKQTIITAIIVGALMKYFGG